MACGVSIMYLIKVGKEEKSLKIAGRRDRRPVPERQGSGRSQLQGDHGRLPMLTLGIITGAAWANYAWGLLSWDPKETWSLIVWFIYAAFLHARFTRGWVGRRVAWLSIFGLPPRFSVTSASTWCSPACTLTAARRAINREKK